MSDVRRSASTVIGVNPCDTSLGVNPCDTSLGVNPCGTLWAVEFDSPVVAGDEVTLSAEDPVMAESLVGGVADLSMPCVAGERHPSANREGSKVIESPVKAGGLGALGVLSQVVGIDQQCDAFSTLVKTCHVCKL